MRRSHFLLIFCLSTFIASAQNNLTSVQLKEDFDIFESSIRTIHPGLHWYLDSATVDGRFVQIRSGLDQDQSLQTFYTSLLGFYANIGCGHSWLSMPSALRKQWETGPYMMPFYLYNTGDLWYVTYNLSEQNLPVQSQLMSINGLSMTAIIDSLTHFAPTDGFIMSRKRRIAKQNLNYYYQTFINSDSTFNITFIPPGETVAQSLSVTGITKQESNERYEARYPDATPSSWYENLMYSSFDSTGTATLTIKTFDNGWLKDNGIKFKKEAKKFFKEVDERGIEKVIIDIRSNGGGDDQFGAILCTYLIPQDFRYFDRMEAITRKFTYGDYSNTNFINLQAKLLKKDREQPGLYTYHLNPPLKPQSPNKYVYDGPVVILQNGGTFSTSSDFATIMHANNRGIFVGEENGGGYYGNNSAIMYDIRLPNSKVTYYIPIIRYYSSVSNPTLIGRGVPADHEIFTSYQDHLDGKDISMIKAKQILSLKK